MRTHWILLGIGALALVAPGCQVADAIFGGTADVVETYNGTPGLPALIGSLGPIGIIVNNAVAVVGAVTTLYWSVRGGRKAVKTVRARRASKPVEPPKA